MRLRDRDIRRVVAAPLRARHWRALGGMLTTYDQPFVALRRYLANAGEYPWVLTLTTPIGPVAVELRDRHDLLTVNEIFCRRDYSDGAGTRVVADIGANVGLAALFFLTRSHDVHVVCFEPDPVNIAQLRRSLAEFDGRYRVVEAAVTAQPVAALEFVPAGRYGHTARRGEGGTVRVPAVEVLAALAEIADKEGPVDLVKVDTEGTEAELVARIRQGHPSSPPAVVFEDSAGRTRWA